MANPFFRYLDTNGDGTGTKNANGDYSLVADDFYFQPTRACYIHRMLVFMEDTSGFTAEEYGNLGAALSNGYEVQLKDSSDGVQVDLTDGVVITTNSSLARTCYDANLKDWGTTPTDEALVARWTFSRAGIPLYMNANDKFVITFNDDLTGLLQHYFMVQGHED